MSKRPWMPFYVDDYLADTRDLTLMQRGAYLLLVVEYWKRGGLPSDEGKLIRLAGMQSKEWAENRDALAELFEHPGWKHKRTDAELARVVEISEKRKNAVNSRRDREASNVVPLKGK